MNTSNTQNPVYVSLEFTPNPNTLKYTVNRQLLESGAANFTSLEEAQSSSPLAARLFEVEGIAGVMIGRDFVTVTRSDSGDWDIVHKSASSIIEEHLTTEQPILLGTTHPSAHKGEGSEVELKIRDILDREIRPAVAMDGGDITFEKYEEGVVYLYLQGSCSGCPSSKMTLKMGIETRLKAVIPELKEVVAI